MNRCPILVVLICFATTCASQNSFDKTYGGPEFDRGMHLIGTSDKGYIACGYTRSFGDNYDIYLVKSDAQGIQQWQKNYGGNNMDIGWSVLELDNGYLLHGSTTTGKGNDDILVMRLDKSGQVLWQKTFGNEKYERATQLLPTSDNNYLLIGQRNIDTTNIDSYIFKIDTAGNLLWEKTFGGPMMERTYYGAETVNGDYLVTGSILPYKNNKADILLTRISADGELRWTKTYGKENVHDIAHSFCINRDKTKFTLTGYVESSIPGFHDGLFIQLDEHGNVLAQKRHHTGEDLRLMHSEETKDGGFIATGFTRKDITQENHDAVLLRFNSFGDTEWMKVFGDDDQDDQGYWVLAGDDGGFVITGYTHSYGRNGDLWIIKTNASGN